MSSKLRSNLAGQVAESEVPDSAAGSAPRRERASRYGLGVFTLEDLQLPEGEATESAGHERTCRLRTVPPPGRRSEGGARARPWSSTRLLREAARGKRSALIVGLFAAAAVSVLAAAASAPREPARAPSLQRVPVTPAAIVAEPAARAAQDATIVKLPHATPETVVTPGPVVSDRVASAPVGSRQGAPPETSAPSVTRRAAGMRVMSVLERPIAPPED